jgi:hypothetical protein
VKLEGVPFVAWAAAGLSVAFALTAVGLRLAIPGQSGAPEEATDSLFTDVLFSLCFAPVGLVILSKHPKNRIGWVALGLGVTAGAIAMLIDLSRAFGGRASRPGLDLGLLSDIGWLVTIALLGWFLLLFPTGHLPSPRWHPVAWALGLWPPLFLVVVVLAPVSMQGGEAVANPFVRIGGPVGDSLNLALTVLTFMLLPLLGGVALASITRFLRSREVERQQLKWVAYSAGLIVVTLLVSAIWPGRAADVMSNLSLLALPIAVAIAILRYRLYDIDLLINRTVVYGATSAAIAATFFAGIVALQGLLRPLTSGSEIAVAASTLVSFTLFQPIRRWVQGAIDQRFDRTRYDAARTLDAFTDDLRDEVDLDALRSDLLGAVSRTMSPAHASLWLREHRR